MTIGQPISRVDGRQKVTGGATYAAEFDVPGQAHGAIVRSTVARGRIAWIDSQFLPAPAFSQKEGPISPGAKLTLRAPVGKVYYTLDGTDPRAPGGAVAAQAHQYSSSLTLNESARVFARARNEDDWSGPALAKYTVTAAASH